MTKQVYDLMIAQANIPSKYLILKELYPDSCDEEIYDWLKDYENDIVNVVTDDDPINLILCDLRGDKELYSLFSSSDEILFLEGELGIGRFEWSESDNKLVYYKHYIVHNRMDRVEIFFDDRASYKILETQVNTGEDTGLARDFVFL